MKLGQKAILTFFIVLIITGGGCKNKTADTTFDPTEYSKNIQAWQASRLIGLKVRDGWLSLIALYWLKPGENTFGSAEQSDLKVTIGGIPDQIGIFSHENDKVHFRATAGIPVTEKGKSVTEILMKSDASGRPTTLSHASLKWHIIKRGDRLGVRLKDTENLKIDQLKSIPTFPIDPSWRVEAVLERYDQSRIIDIPDVLGNVNKQKSPGVLVFQIGGKSYSLHPTGGKGNLSLVFGDASNGNDTYGGGRFLTVPKPDEKGHTIIDFNRAYNPPCVFSNYATCPLPPEGNRLPIPVKAGEKMVDLFHH